MDHYPDTRLSASIDFKSIDYPNSLLNVACQGKVHKCMNTTQFYQKITCIYTCKFGGRLPAFLIEVLYIFFLLLSLGPDSETENPFNIHVDKKNQILY